MKKLFLIQDTAENKVSYYHLACFLIALPFDSFYSEIILASFAFHTLVHVNKTRWQQLLKKKTLLLVSLNILGLCGLLYSRYRHEGITLITSQLAFLLFPLLFILNKLNLAKYKWALMKIFGFTCILVIIFLFADAIHILRYFHLPVIDIFSKEFINQNFTEPLKLHATYFSMYVAFSLSVFLFLLVHAKLKKEKIIYAVCVFILLVGLIQLSSRAVLIAMLIIAFIAFPALVLRGKKRIFFLLTVFLVSFGIFYMISHVSSYNERFIGELKNDLKPASSTGNNIAEPRIDRWKAEIELIKQSPVIGYGTGSERQILMEKYFEKKLYLSYALQFNAHSQYLSFLLSYGVIGLALFLAILVYGFVTAIKNNDILMISFLIIIAVTCISEDVLNINKGIFFYGFFMPFFLLTYKSKRKLKVVELSQATHHVLPAI